MYKVLYQEEGISRDGNVIGHWIGDREIGNWMCGIASRNDIAQGAGDFARDSSSSLDKLKQCQIQHVNIDQDVVLENNGAIVKEATEDDGFVDDGMKVEYEEPLRQDMSECNRHSKK